MKRRSFFARLLGAAIAPVLPTITYRALVCNEVAWQQAIVLAMRGRVNPFSGLMDSGPDVQRPIEVLDFSKLS